MAALTGTTQTYGVGSGGGNREDLSNTIYDLFPEDTYFLTNLDKTSASSTHHEWLGDTLVAAGSNINEEGDDGSFSSIVSPIRYGNYTQIFKKEFLVSGTQEAVAKAGRKTEGARQSVKQMRELKNDVEYAIVRNQHGTAGGAGTGRSLASIENWIGATSPSASAATQIVLNTSTTAGHNTAETASGTPGAVTDGTATAVLTVGTLNLALQGAWDDGGMTDVVAVSAAVKQDIDGFAGVATRNIDVGRGKQASITNAADLYVSSFGVHKVLLHRHVRTSVVLCLDTSYWAVSSLRPFFMEKLAKTGDGDKYSIRTELTLECRSWRANSKVVGIST
jgi:hypothetical protein